MKYVRVEHAEMPGEYGFDSTITVQRAEDGRLRILRTNFQWRGAQSGIHASRQGPLSKADSERLVQMIRVARDQLDIGETLAYVELRSVVERCLDGSDCVPDIVEIP